jgi:energy-coupling factor transporter ATP-binding protein EcfA2
MRDLRKKAGNYELLEGETYDAYSGTIVYNEAIEVLKGQGENRINIVNSNFKKTNELLMGFGLNQFTILTGPTGSGKTQWLANLSAALFEQGVPQFIASIETGAIDYFTRVLGVLALRDLNTAKMSSEEIDQLADKYRQTFVDKGHYLQIVPYEDRVSVPYLMRQIKACVDRTGAKVVILDNLNFFLDVTTAQNQLIEMDKVVHSLVIFCKEINIHMILVMHPKKTDGGRITSEFDIKGSSTAVQEASNILLFNRVSPEVVKKLGIQPDAERYFRELKISKMRRNGEFVGKTILLKANKEKVYHEFQ